MLNYINIANKARDSISNFCITKCKAKCCKKGKLLIMTDEELDLVVGLNKVEKYFNKKILEYSKKNNNFLLYNSEIKICRQLDKKTNICKEHKNPNRPQVCKDYPIFIIKGKYVIFSKNCPAVDSGMFKDYENQFIQLGLKII